MFKSVIAMMMKPRIIHLLSVMIFGSILVLAIMGNIDEHGRVDEPHIPIYSDVYEGCFYKTNWGIDCPTCGLSRAFYAFFDGQLALATDFNPLVWPVLFLFGIMIVNSLYYLIRESYSKIVLTVLYIVIGIVIVTFVYRYVFVIRNIIMMQ